MKEKLDNILLSNMDPQLVMYCTIASLVIGVILLFVGFYLKKKGKKWGTVISLIGVLGVAINAIRLI
ncbi:hypothetical protein [Clostridium cibarium]|uniref:LPXTG cell wall anchor domain-containing protein n=1 Tax=Clostridium cibarium TaxID=2762247 RepID=A0ABR8PWB0_9CLOT|nr:hypothetical protein [Clostridium cibarium]MBD7912462.1 hypothetical protein [Clostridium cibarium]